MIKSSTLVLWSILTSTVFSGFVIAGPEVKKSVADFSTASLVGWEPIEFNSETKYHFVKNEGAWVLQSNSQNSASGLIRKQKIDIRKFPYLNWRWLAKTRLGPRNEQSKKGDDYVARIYVVVSDGWFFWQTKALMYVWSSQGEKDAVWPNAYAPDNTLMMAIRTSKDASNTWFYEKRNVYEDLQKWLGKSIDQIDAIAIMTDTDDGHLEASAMYGDIYFSSE